MPWLASCWVIWDRKIGMLQCLTAHTKSAETNWVSTNRINKWGTEQTATCLLCYTTKGMTWNLRSVPRRSDAYWKSSLCWALGFETNGFQRWCKPGFWLHFVLFTINIGFHLHFNEEAILSSWQYGCTSSVEPELAEAEWEPWFAVLGSNSAIQLKGLTQILSNLQIYIKQEPALFMLDIYRVQKRSVRRGMIADRIGN